MTPPNNNSNTKIANDQTNHTDSLISQAKNLDSYLNFETENDFNTYMDDYDQKFNQQISKLQGENLILKKQTLQIRDLNDKLGIFTKEIAQKYGCTNVKFDDKQLDFNSFQDLEKSMLRYLEANNITYQKTDSKLEKEPVKLQPKIFI